MIMGADKNRLQENIEYDGGMKELIPAIQKISARFCKGESAA